MRSFLIATFLFSLLFNSAHACSLAFSNTNNIAKVSARSMDLYTPDLANIFARPRGKNYDGGAGTNSLKWKSLYGSVVITAFNTPTVSDGINEAGMAAHLLYLHTTQYEKRNPAMPAITNGIWAQYVLDNFKSVDEALAALQKVQIVSAKIHGREWPMHLAIEDASGDSAVIEFINGKTVIHHGHQYQVMTNEPAYDIQLANLKKYKLFGGSLSMPGDIDPLSRFVRASSFLKTSPKPKDYKEAIANILSVIRTVMVPFGADDTSAGISTDTWPTIWISLSDMSQKIFYFESTTAPNIVWIDLNTIDFKEGSPTLTIDPMRLDLTGDISKKLVPFTD